MELLIVKLPKGKKDKFKQSAISERKTMSDLIREFIEHKIDTTTIK